MVAARAGSKPIFTSSTLTRLRISRPAPTSSTHAKAISDTTRALRTQLRPRLSVDPRLASFRALVMTEPDACSAGARPKTMPVTSAMTTVKPSAVPSSADVAQQRNAHGFELRQQARAAQREDEAEHRAAARQHEALGEHLRQQPSAAGAERHADGDFLLTRRHAREQQVRQVGADDQHHHRDRAGEHPHGEPGRCR